MTGGGTTLQRPTTLRRRTTLQWPGLPTVAVLAAVGVDLLTVSHLLVGASAVALRIAVAVLVVLVAGVEPLLAFVASAPLALLLTRPPTAADAVVARPVDRRGPATDFGLVRCLPRRGPPGVASRA